MSSERDRRPRELQLEAGDLPLRLVLSVRSRLGAELERRNYLLRHTRHGKLVLNRDESLDRPRRR